MGQVGLNQHVQSSHGAIGGRNLYLSEEMRNKDEVTSWEYDMLKKKKQKKLVVPCLESACVHCSFGE